MVMPGIDPKKLAEVQEVSKFIDAEIVVDYKRNLVRLALSSDNPASAQMIPGLLSQLAEGLATQLNSFFAIKGELVEIKK